MKGACFGRNPFETLSNIELQVDLTPLFGILWPVTPPHVAKVISGHERLPAVFRQKKLWRDQLERLKHNSCVQANDTDWLICSMTFSVRLTLVLVLRSIFNMIFQDQVIFYSTRLDKRSTMVVKRMACLYWLNTYCRKQTFFVKKTAVL